MVSIVGHQLIQAPQPVGAWRQLALLQLDAGDCT